MTPSILYRIAHGDSNALRECVQEYGPLVWSLALRLSCTTTDAEEATEEIFQQIWSQAGLFDDSWGSEKIFIAVIARRCLVSRRPKPAAIYPSSEMLEPVEWLNIGKSSETSIEVEQAVKALELLAPADRQVVELSLLHGLNQAAIASRLNVTLARVTACMRVGLNRVRHCMDMNADRSPVGTPAIAATSATRYGLTSIPQPKVALGTASAVCIGSSPRAADA